MALTCLYTNVPVMLTSGEIDFVMLLLNPHTFNRALHGTNIIIVYVNTAYKTSSQTLTHILRNANIFLMNIAGVFSPKLQIPTGEYFIKCWKQNCTIAFIYNRNNHYYSIIENLILSNKIFIMLV